MYRKPLLDKIHSSTYQLGPKALEDAFETIRNDIANIDEINHPTTKHNLTRDERITLKQFMQNDKLITNKADKGCTIVVRDRADYRREGLKHLSDVVECIRMPVEFVIT